MSFLAPLFLLGALTVALPVLFHLIRRTTRERVPFSSLMFLSPTPPRVTRRSRLENILLLLLRCLVVGLLAFAFARPFFQQALLSDTASGPGRRIVLLVDTSASMRREGLWPDAQALAAARLKNLSPADQVAVFTFERQVNRLVTFEDWNSLAPPERTAAALKRLEAARPTWRATQLGGTLVSAVETLEGGEGAQKNLGRQKQIVLISDVQEGSRVEALQAFEWPKGVELVLAPVKARHPTNAGLQLAPESEDTASRSETETRVRVFNAGDSRHEQFQVGWARGAEKAFAGTAVDVYVPPGQSRIVSVPPPPAGGMTDHLLLKGDEEDFDNAVFAAAPEPSRAKVLFLGQESEKDTAQPLYFLQRAFQQTRRQIVQVTAHTPDAPLTPADVLDTPLIIVSDTPAPDRTGSLRRLLAEGRTILFAMKSPAAAGALGSLLGVDSLQADEATVGDYAMLGEIDFKHPLFAPFADPRFSDFTKIHFWKHRRLAAEKIPNARVLARFDDGDAALLEAPAGKGRVFVLTAGWHAADSQLAVSSKFVPLLYSLLELSGGVRAAPTQYYVGDEVIVSAANLPADAGTAVHKPDGSEVKLPKGETRFSQTDQPGFYTVTWPGGTQRFAVNLDPAESRTAPLAPDELERLGVPLKAAGLNTAQQAETQRRLQNSELESRQKLWRWLIVAALLALLVETWLAGWLSRRSTAETSPA